MRRGLVLHYPEPEWAKDTFASLLPGGHVAVFGSFRTAVEAEEAGFEVRDCIIVLGPTRHRVWLLRRPIEASSVAAQVLRTGTGAIWIDGCRVSSPDGEHFRSTVKGRSGGMSAGDERDGAALGMFQPDSAFEPTNHPGGRWPPNFLFVHFPGCLNAGTKRIKGISGGETRQGALGLLNDDSWESGEVTVHKFHDEDGLETVPSWNCVPGCYAGAMDAQTGVLKSGPAKPGYIRKNLRTEKNRGVYHGGFGDDQLTGYGDEGGASRFFPQFKDEAELDRWLTRLILGESSSEPAEK